MPDVYVAVGSNIRRRSSIKKGMRMLHEQYGKLDFSPVYETKAVGFKGAPFYNFVVKFVTDEAPEQIAKNMKLIEHECGRSPRGPKFHARTLDLDLLLYGDLQQDKGKIQLPRAEIFKYAFVLEPLAEMVPDLVCPGKRKSFAQLWSSYQEKNTLEPVRLLDWVPIRASLLS